MLHVIDLAIKALDGQGLGRKREKFKPAQAVFQRDSVIFSKKQLQAVGLKIRRNVLVMLQFPCKQLLLRLQANKRLENIFIDVLKRYTAKISGCDALRADYTP